MPGNEMKTYRPLRIAGIILGLFAIAHAHLLGSVVLGWGEEPSILIFGHALALVLASGGAFYG